MGHEYDDIGLEGHRFDCRSPRHQTRHTQEVDAARISAAQVAHSDHSRVEGTSVARLFRRRRARMTREVQDFCWHRRSSGCPARVAEREGTMPHFVGSLCWWHPVTVFSRVKQRTICWLHSRHSDIGFSDRPAPCSDAQAGRLSSGGKDMQIEPLSMRLPPTFLFPSAGIVSSPGRQLREAGSTGRLPLFPFTHQPLQTIKADRSVSRA